MATLLPLIRHPHWFIRGMDFPRVQLTSVALILLLTQFMLLDLNHAHNWALISVTFACSLWQLWWILPYTPIWPFEVQSTSKPDPKRKLSVLTANVFTPNKQADALLKLVRQHQPDILVTLESDMWWQQQLDSLEAEMPYSLKCPLDNLYGMHLYSRLPLEEREIAYLVEQGVPSMHVLVRLRTGDTVRMHFLHPAPPSPTENTESTERDAELMIVARDMIKRDQPTVVTGDLNDVAWSSTTRLFRKLSSLLDPRVGRGMYNTFHAEYPLLRWPLDHLFHSEHFTVNTIQCLPYFGSDHFALVTELYYTPRQGGGQEGLTADAGDKARGKALADKKTA